MRDAELLAELLAAESEAEVVSALEKRKLLTDMSRWQYLGGMPNNQSIVHAQQSSAAAALVEKYTNGVDAILLRQAKAKGIDPRGTAAPQSMPKAIDDFFGDLTEKFSGSGKFTKDREQLRTFAEDHLVLYATGSKTRPTLSFFDAGEGQLPDAFPTTLCSLIHGTSGGSYKGAIPFVQGRFNMGSSGVLPFCSEQYKLQLIVSRVPSDVAGGDTHEWGYTLLCFFRSKQDPSWRYLVGPDQKILTAGREPLGLIPISKAKSGALSPPRERAVPSGTLIKMYDIKVASSNICGELYKHLNDFLLRPPLPLRIVECRESRQANVMRVTVWDRLGTLAKDKIEEGFEDGASIDIKLSTGETIPAEVRVFKVPPKPKGTLANDDQDQPQTGLRALINGQSHAKRDAQFFRTKAVDLEHIAGSMLVLLDCTDLGQDARNALFMSNRETFREDPLLQDLFKKLQKELSLHEGLVELNKKRYAEKVADAVDDEDGIKALEELLADDPNLADLFGSENAGKVAAKTAPDGTGGKVEGPATPFVGVELPTYFRRPDGTSIANISIPKGDVSRVGFKTDVKNNYFSRKKHRGVCTFSSPVQPTFHLFNGRLTFTCAPDKSAAIGSTYVVEATITDNAGSGPFNLKINATIGPPATPKPPGTPRPPQPPKVDVAPSRPDISEVHKGPDAAPLMIEKVPNSERMRLLLNLDSPLLAHAKSQKPEEEALAVEFVFKYGLALIALSLLDAAKKTDKWKEDETECRSQIERTAAGIARVIVPLCLSLPSKLPKKKSG